MTSFEALFSAAQRLVAPRAEDQRVVDWCDGGQRVGLARETGGGYEVFITGERLRAHLPLVRRHLRHDRWRAEGKAEFTANRLILPSDSHFVAVAAFLVEELLRHGVTDTPQAAFDLTEPLIEMALRGTTLPEETVLGLLGELIFLEALLSGTDTDERRAACIGAWRGYEHAARDFTFPNQVVVEVKVTRGVHSRHHISSVAQVDPRRSPDGVPLERLWLLSIGLSSEKGDVTLPGQVDAILGQLGPSIAPERRNAIQALFLSYVERYGATTGAGYSHDEMRGWAAYGSAWTLRFNRAYDMLDEEVAVLTLADVERRHFVPTETVTFEVDFPDEFRAPGNPNPDLPSFVSEVFGGGA